MKAKELAKILLEKPEAEVIVASDEEGNSFATINEKSVEVGLKEITIYPWEVIKE